MHRDVFLRLWHSPTFTTWGSLGVRLGGALLVLPLVLVRFEPAEVALWQLLTTLYMLTLLLDFGLAPTFARLMSYARSGANIAQMQAIRDGTADLPAAPAPQPPGRPCNATLRRVFDTLRWLYPRIALAIGALLALLGTLALLHPASQLEHPADAWWAWIVTLCTTVAALWGNSWSAALQGMDRIAEVRRWEIAFGLLQVASSLLALALGGGLVWLVVAYQGWLVAGAIRNRWLLKRLHPELFTARPLRDPEVVTLMWPAAWRSGVGVLMGHGLIHSSGVVYSQLAPAAEVAAYLLALRFAFTVSQFSQAPFYSKLPRLALLHAAGQREEQIALAQRGMFIAHWVFAAGAVAVGVGGPWLLEAIGSRTAFVPQGVWVLMALAFFAERYGAMHLQLYSLTHRILWHIANGVTGIAMLVFAVAAFPFWGAYAFPAAMLLAYAGLYCTYSAYHSRNAFGLGLLRFELRTAVPALVVLCLGLATAGVATRALQKAPARAAGDPVSLPGAAPPTLTSYTR